MAYIKRIGAKIYYEFHKSKKPCIIFLHGLMENTTIWNNQLKYFQEKGFSTLAIDFRGHGKSDKLDLVNQYKISLLAADVNYLIKKLKISKFHLIAKSMGGMVGEEFMFKYKKYPLSLILISTSFCPSMEKKWDYSKDVLANISKGISKAIGITKLPPWGDDLSKIYPSTPLTVFFFGFTHSTLNAALDYGYDVLKFNCLNYSMPNIPTLIMHGADDFTFSVFHANEIQKCIPWAQVQIIKGGGHFFTNQFPNETNAQIDNFLKLQEKFL